MYLVQAHKSKVLSIDLAKVTRIAREGSEGATIEGLTELRYQALCTITNWDLKP
jgi:hypothetical protein